MSLFKKIVTALHKLRGYHCGRAAIFEQSFTTQQVNAGNISSSDAAKVRAKANKKLGKKKP